MRSALDFIAEPSIQIEVEMRKCSSEESRVLGSVAVISLLAFAQTAQPAQTAQNDHSEAAKPSAKAKPFDLTTSREFGMRLHTGSPRRKFRVMGNSATLRQARKMRREKQNIKTNAKSSKKVELWWIAILGGRRAFLLALAAGIS